MQTKFHVFSHACVLFQFVKMRLGALFLSVLSKNSQLFLSVLSKNIYNCIKINKICTSKDSLTKL